MKERDEYGRGHLMIRIDDWIEHNPVTFQIVGGVVYVAAQLGGIGVVMYVLQDGLTRLAQGGV